MREKVRSPNKLFMNKKIADAKTALIKAVYEVNWNDPDLDLKAIIEAQKKGSLRVPFVDWLRKKSWQIEEFIVSDKFVESLASHAGVQIAGVGDNFKNFFAHPVKGADIKELSFITVESRTFETSIISKVGGVVESIVSLADIFHMLEIQPRGKESPAGDLLTDGNANVFHVPQGVKWRNNHHFSYGRPDGEEVNEEVDDSKYLFKMGDEWFVLRKVFAFWHRDQGRDRKVGWYMDAEHAEKVSGSTQRGRVFRRVPKK